MSSFNLNKIMMAGLLTSLAMIGISSLTEVIFEQEYPAKNAFPIKVEVATAAPTKTVMVKKEVSLAALLAVASVEKGQKIFKKCQACHNSTKGAGKKVGPDLWDVVGRPKGSVEGFSYSDGMKAKGGNWSYHDLFIFLKKPKDFVARTKMGFAGLKKAKDRAAVIALLRTLSDAPLALPVVQTPQSPVDNPETTPVDNPETTPAG